MIAGTDGTKRLARLRGDDAHALTTDVLAAQFHGAGRRPRDHYERPAGAPGRLET